MEPVVFQRNHSVSDQEQNPMPRIAFRPLVLIAVLALMAVIVGAQAPVPQPEDQETAQESLSICSNETTWLVPSSMMRSPSSGATISSRTSTRRSITS